MNQSRRRFLKSTGLGFLALGLPPAFLVRAAEAQQAGKGKVMVVVFQRGAMDGLNAVIPFKDAAYYTLPLMAAAALAAAGLAEAMAQSPFPPVGQQASPFPPVGQQASPFPPVGQQSPFPQVGQQQQKPPCFDEFIPLREDVDKRFQAAKAGIDRRASAAEMCSLLTKFGQAETKVIKYVRENGAACNFPPSLLQSVEASNVKTEGYRKQACTAAAAPAKQPRPAAPTLSDALSPPVATKDNTKTGRGTLDSLSGNPLAR